MGYLKLVHMEVHRFRYILLSLMTLTMLSQLGVMIAKLLEELSARKRNELGRVLQEYSAFFPSGKTSFAETVFQTQFWFIVPILLSIAVLALYVFLIWYRDWVGRQTFIYRLLMLPSARRNIYLAKFTAIVIFVLSLVSFQIILLHIEQVIFNLIVPADLRVASYFADVISANQALAVLLPRNMDEFLVSYGIGFLAIIAIFTAVLIERSYRRIGIVYAILYLLVCTFIVVFPMMAFGIDSPSASLYPAEIFGIELVMLLAVALVSIGLGFRLMAKKITV
jgi:hypothetical protein